MPSYIPLISFEFKLYSHVLSVQAIRCQISPEVLRAHSIRYIYIYLLELYHYRFIFKPFVYLIMR